VSDVVTDTHSLIWYLEDESRLGPEADRTFEVCDCLPLMTRDHKIQQAGVPIIW